MFFCFCDIGEIRGVNCDGGYLFFSVFFNKKINDEKVDVIIYDYIYEIKFIFN